MIPGLESQAVAVAVGGVGVGVGDHVELLAVPLAVVVRTGDPARKSERASSKARELGL
jgi:hypothetical protein